tara:strand:- start:10809 stop:11042 length:234 start_codon:yes stop_codon:yes gene_type:complete
MDSLTHTIIAVGSLAGFFYAGCILTRWKMTEEVIGTLLDRLEKEGLIATVTGKDGEKDIIPISEIIAKTVNDKMRAK